MFSKKFTALAIALSVFTLGSSHVATAASNTLITTSSVDKKDGSGAVTSAFDMGQQVYAYLTLIDKPENQPKQLEARWYHCGKLVTTYPFASTPNKEPHHVWFWINSSELGAGPARVDVRSGNSLLSRASFDVRSATGKTTACPTPPKSISLSADALFAFGKSGINDVSDKGLSELRNAVTQINEAYSKVNSITVVGHTDSIGQPAANQALSEARAATVRDLLINNGVPAGIIRSEGRAATQNVTSCSPSLPRAELIACKAPDRRVSIQINGIERKIDTDE